MTKPKKAGRRAREWFMHLTPNNRLVEPIQFYHTKWDTCKKVLVREILPRDRGKKK